MWKSRHPLQATRPRLRLAPVGVLAAAAAWCAALSPAPPARGEDRFLPAASTLSASIDFARPYVALTSVNEAAGAPCPVSLTECTSVDEVLPVRMILQLLELADWAPASANRMTPGPASGPAETPTWNASAVGEIALASTVSAPSAMTRDDSSPWVSVAVGDELLSVRMILSEGPMAMHRPESAFTEPTTMDSLLWKPSDVAAADMSIATP